MTQAEPLIRNVSDTARWVAYYRAEESSRPMQFSAIPSHDVWPESVESRLPDPDPFTGKTSWPFVARTYLFDRIIQSKFNRASTWS